MASSSYIFLLIIWKSKNNFKRSSKYFQKYINWYWRITNDLKIRFSYKINVKSIEPNNIILNYYGPANLNDGFWHLFFW